MAGFSSVRMYDWNARGLQSSLSRGVESVAPKHGTGNLPPKPSFLNASAELPSRVCLCQRVHHPIHRRVLPVLHLHPMLRPAALIRALSMLGDKAL